MVKAGDFPPPVYISERRKAWPEAEISAWMEAAAASRRRTRE
jgi:predicted DNA-binding transcriptional regulator AlpA